MSVAGNVKDFFSMLQVRNVEIELVSPKVFESLLDLPVLTIKKKSHSDMIDRVIIADCIANKYTMVSHDAKFPYYRKYGLKLLEA